MHSTKLSLLFRSAPLCCAALAACGSVPTRTFDIGVIDTREQSMPALIVVGNQDWGTAAEKQQFVNVGKTGPRATAIEFPRNEIEVSVVPITVANEQPIVPKTLQEMKALGLPPVDSRRLRIDDHPNVLFILPPAASR